VSIKIRWVPLAIADLEDAADFISKDNPEAARKMVRRIWEAAKLLASHPRRQSGPRAWHARADHWRHAFILPYRVKDNTVQILRVLHSSRKWPLKFAD